MADVYALDTNVYIEALRNAGRLARLKKFLLRAGARVRFSAVVALELRAGARARVQEKAVDDLLAPYAEREQIVVPTFRAYVEAGRVLAALSVRERVALGSAPPSLRNDALLAASCRESEVVLVTENSRDFAAIQRHLRGFRFAARTDVI